MAQLGLIPSIPPMPGGGVYQRKITRIREAWKMPEPSASHQKFIAALKVHQNTWNVDLVPKCIATADLWSTWVFLANDYPIVACHIMDWAKEYLIVEVVSWDLGAPSVTVTFPAGWVTWPGLVITGVVTFKAPTSWYSLQDGLGVIFAYPIGTF